MSMQVTKVWWDGDKLMAEPISAAEVYKPEPVTEWLTCPKCGHKNPYSPIKAKTLAEDAERITKQARAALAQMRQEPVGRISANCEGILRQEVMLYTDEPLRIGTAVYTRPQAREPLEPVVPEDANVNQRISFKAGWRAAEAAHGIKGGQHG